MYKALDVAKWFICRYAEIEEPGEPLTLMKLLKLLYYAEGCSLALNDKSLFSEDIIAWEHGPVVPVVYDVYKKNPYNLTFNRDECKDIVSQIENDKESLSVLEQVFEVFGEYSAWALRNKTHQEDPWKEATKNGLNGKISRDTMKRYFKENYVE